MIDPDTLKQAVELAPGWSMNGHCIVPPDGSEVHATVPNPVLLDALAAELVRLVDAMDKYRLDSFGHVTQIFEFGGWGQDERTVCLSGGPDRTANTINAIVQFARENPGVLSDG